MSAAPAKPAAPAITYAKYFCESKKGEDAAAMVIQGNAAPAAFAIFDGHSGKDTAKICSEVVCQRLMEKGAPFEEKTVVDTFWAVDEEIGTSGKRDGATATVLLIEKAGEDTSALKCMFAWTGDSSAVQADMEDGSVVFATESHTAGPDHQEGGAYAREKLMLEHYRAVRKAVEANAGIDTIEKETTPEMVKAALEGLGKEADDEEVALLVRAFRRGKVIAETNPQGAESRKEIFVRQRDLDHDPNRVWVVATAEHRSNPGYSDLQMTRSMCDWRASDLVLPHPQIHTCEVPANACHRICLASDGLWDVCSFEKAAEVMKNASTPAVAARRLLKICSDEYFENRGHEHFDDDTTILVIELNPSGIKHIGTAGGCCSIQ